MLAQDPMFQLAYEELDPDEKADWNDVGDEIAKKRRRVDGNFRMQSQAARQASGCCVHAMFFSGGGPPSGTGTWKGGGGRGAADAKAKADVGARIAPGDMFLTTQFFGLVAGVWVWVGRGEGSGSQSTS